MTILTLRTTLRRSLQTVYSSVHSVHNRMQSSTSLPVNWSAFVLSSVSSDTDPTIVVNFDSARYVFNVGECTTRAFLQSTQTWRKTKCIFLNRINTERSAGLPGFLMTLADNAVERVKILGPPGLLHFIASMRHYVYRDTLSVEPIEIRAPALQDAYTEISTPCYQDENINVFAVHSFPQRATHASNLKRKQDCHPNDGTSSKRPHRSDALNDKTEGVKSLIVTSPNVLNNSTEYISNTIGGTECRYVPTCSLTEGSDAEDYRRSIINGMFKQLPNEGGALDQSQSFNRRPRHDRILPHWLPATMTRKADIAEDPLCVGGQSISYVIHGPRIRGKFDAKKAGELGLKPGPLRGKVAKGETVEFTVKLPDGREEVRKIGPNDCLGPPEKVVVLCIIDCPSPLYVEELVNSPEWTPYQTLSESSDYVMHAIFHLVGDGVLEDARYLQWLNSFDPMTHHLIANRRYCNDPITFKNAAFHQLQLHQLDRDIFPIPHFTLNPPVALQSVLRLPVNSQPLSTDQIIEFRPLRPPIIDAQIIKKDKFHPNAIRSTQNFLPQHISAIYKEAKNSVRTAATSLASVDGDTLIIPLGTSSATPSKYRNVSSTLVKIRNYGNILFDCGEGTWGQLARHFGMNNLDVQNVSQQLRDLKCIFISHLHGDHHIGLSKVLSMRKKLDPPPSDPVYLIAESGVHLYLREYADLENLGLLDQHPGAVKPVFAEDLHWKSRMPFQRNEQDRELNEMIEAPSLETVTNDLRHLLGLCSFETVDVVHRTKCYGAIIKHMDGWSITFSGDTMPSQNLVKAGLNSTLLIHEATMANDESELAKKKAHSTVGEAIDVGIRMNAQNILLTHFSARYPKMPPNQKPSSCEDGPVVALALDHVQIPLHSLWKLSMYVSAIEHTFADADECEAI